MKSVIIGTYLCVTFWVSLHVAALSMVFYPSLGSFGFLIAYRPHEKKDLVPLAIGATVTSAVGSVLHFLAPGIIMLFVTSLITLYLMQRMNWIDAPILAVSLVPYFSHIPHIWTLPVSVLVSVIGLFIPMWLIQRLHLDSSLTQEQQGRISL